jgi:hypothetical protein
VRVTRPFLGPLPGLFYRLPPQLAEGDGLVTRRRGLVSCCNRTVAPPCEMSKKSQVGMPPFNSTPFHYPVVYSVGTVALWFHYPVVYSVGTVALWFHYPVVYSVGTVPLWFHYPVVHHGFTILSFIRVAGEPCSIAQTTAVQCRVGAATRRGLRGMALRLLRSAFPE